MDLFRCVNNLINPKIKELGKNFISKNHVNYMKGSIEDLLTLDYIMITCQNWFEMLEPKTPGSIPEFREH